MNLRATSEVEGEAAGRSYFTQTIHVDIHENRRKDNILFLNIFVYLQKEYDWCKILWKHTNSTFLKIPNHPFFQCTHFEYGHVYTPYVFVHMIYVRNVCVCVIQACVMYMAVIYKCIYIFLYNLSKWGLPILCFAVCNLSWAFTHVNQYSS